MRSQGPRLPETGHPEGACPVGDAGRGSFREQTSPWAGSDSGSEKPLHAEALLITDRGDEGVRTCEAKCGRHRKEERGSWVRQCHAKFAVMPRPQPDGLGDPGT